MCLFFLAGCTALISDNDPEADGVSYYLPKTILDIAVTQKKNPETGDVWYHIGSVNKDKEVLSEAVDVTVPDLDHRYVLSYTPSKVSDDRLCITRGSNGLLHDVEFAADDRTPEIVFNISRFLASVFKEVPTSVTLVPNTAKDEIEERTYSSRLDPYNPKDIAAFNTNMSRVFGAPVKLDFKRMMQRLEALSIPPSTHCDVKGGHCPVAVVQQHCPPDKICYRTKLKMPVDLKLFGKTVDVDYVPVINRGDFGAISVERAFLVHSITQLRFDQGVLIASTIRKPSEVEEASLLPLHVFNAVIATPSGLWANAFSDQNDNAALIQKVTDLNTAAAGVITQNKAVFQSLETGAVPTHGNDETKRQKFKPNCKFGRGAASTFNFFAATNINQPLD